MGRFPFSSKTHSAAAAKGIRPVEQKIPRGEKKKGEKGRALVLLFLVIDGIISAARIACMAELGWRRGKRR